MRLLIPQIFWTGISISYYSGLLTMTIISTVDSDDESVQLTKSMNAMIMFGVGSLCGTILIGYITDNVGSRIGIPLNIIFLATMLLVSMTFIY